MRGDESMINSNCSVISRILAWKFLVRQKQLHDQRPRPGGGKLLGQILDNHSTSDVIGLTGDRSSRTRSAKLADDHVVRSEDTWQEKYSWYPGVYGEYLVGGKLEELKRITGRKKASGLKETRKNSKTKCRGVAIECATLARTLWRTPHEQAKNGKRAAKRQRQGRRFYLLTI